MTQDKQGDIELRREFINVMKLNGVTPLIDPEDGGFDDHFSHTLWNFVQRYTEQRVAKAVSDQTDWLSVNHERAVLDARIAEQRQTQSNLPHCGGNNCMSCLYQKEWGDNHLTELEAQRQSLEDNKEKL